MSSQEQVSERDQVSEAAPVSEADSRPDGPSAGAARPDDRSSLGPVDPGRPAAADSAPPGPPPEGAPQVPHETSPEGGHDPALGEPPPPATVPVVVPRWIQVVALVLAVLGGYALARAAHTVVLIFIVAAVIALILNPLVSFVHRRRFPRGLAVLTVYLTFFLSLVGIGFLLATPVSNQIKAFNRDIPSITRSANKSLADVQKFLDRNGIHVQIVKPGKTALQTLSENVAKQSSSIVSFTGSLLTKVVSIGFELILVFVLSVYMLVYGPRIGRLVRTLMPAGDGTPEDDYPLRVQRSVSSYVRGQLLFSLIMGTTAGLCLYLFGLIGLFSAGKSYAVVFGAFYGISELIPFVGPVLGAIPPVLVALFQDPLTAVWVAVLFLALQQVEGHIVAPQIFGHALRINPLLVIFTLTVGGSIYGIVGALIALPVAAVIRETALYLQRHVVLEPWEVQRPAWLAGRAGGGGSGPAPKPGSPPARSEPPAGDGGAAQPRDGDQGGARDRDRARASAGPGPGTG